LLSLSIGFLLFLHEFHAEVMLALLVLSFCDFQEFHFEYELLLDEFNYQNGEFTLLPEPDHLQLLDFLQMAHFIELPLIFTQLQQLPLQRPHLHFTPRDQ
jgi:hypothetical protein